MPKYFYNPETLLYEVKKDNKYLKHIKVALLILTAPALMCLYFWIYVSVLHLELPKTAWLKRQHASWEARMDILDRQMDIYEQTLTGIEQRDDDVYRSIYGLSPIPEELRNSGLEGVNRYNELDALGANSRLKLSVHRLDALMKRVYLRSRALDEMWDISSREGDMISCVPNVPPLMTTPGNFRLSSGFAYREDPVYGGAERHVGQDFAADKGTPVYVTGDGVVEKIKYNFFGYGNEVVIDHGFGYKTRYAHMQNIDVKKGDVVSRGQQIGTVGNTGSSTGPHLHYEVIYRGKQIDPMSFMDLTMGPEEYQAMVDKVNNFENYAFK